MYLFYLNTFLIFTCLLISFLGSRQTGEHDFRINFRAGLHQLKLKIAYKAGAALYILLIASFMLLVHNNEKQQKNLYLGKFNSGTGADSTLVKIK